MANQDEMVAILVPLRTAESLLKSSPNSYDWPMVETQRATEVALNARSNKMTEEQQKKAQEHMPPSCVDDLFECRVITHAYFGYVEDWVTIAMHDSTEMFWRIEGDAASSDKVSGAGCVVRYALSEEALDEPDEYYVNIVWTQRFLPKWIYRAKEHTMICVETGVDGNRYLQIFSNDKEVTQDG